MAVWITGGKTKQQLCSGQLKLNFWRNATKHHSAVTNQTKQSWTTLSRWNAKMSICIRKLGFSRHSHSAVHSCCDHHNARCGLKTRLYTKQISCFLSAPLSHCLLTRWSTSPSGSGLCMQIKWLSDCWAHQCNITVNRLNPATAAWFTVGCTAGAWGQMYCTSVRTTLSSQDAELSRHVQAPPDQVDHIKVTCPKSGFWRMGWAGRSQGDIPWVWTTVASLQFQVDGLLNLMISIILLCLHPLRCLAYTLWLMLAYRDNVEFQRW